VLEVEVVTRVDQGRELPILVVRLTAGARGIASTVLGGGIGPLAWVVNAHVRDDYARLDPDRHLAELAAAAGLAGRGAGMLTAADVRRFQRAEDGGVEVVATVGLTDPVLAAAADPAEVARAGTINLIVGVPAALSDAALVNVVATATEAKVQALVEGGWPATGTPSDAICVVALDAGPVEPFGGPRSSWGGRVARAAHRAVLAGAEEWQVARGEEPAGGSIEQS
jgi:adenosylcobinamide amidohydrolase